MHAYIQTHTDTHKHTQTHTTHKHTAHTHTHTHTHPFLQHMQSYTCNTHTQTGFKTSKLFPTCLQKFPFEVGHHCLYLCWGCVLQNENAFNFLSFAPISLKLSQKWREFDSFEMLIQFVQDRKSRHFENEKNLQSHLFITRRSHGLF